jgi:predicted DNA-binding ribbon-helix-helix protein
MCRLADWLQSYHEKQTRSLRIGGHCTSIRLEKSFWETLEEIAASEDVSLAKLLTTLHNEVLDHHGEVKNFASLLRCALPGLSLQERAASRTEYRTRPGRLRSASGKRRVTLDLLTTEAAALQRLAA